jgi:hypothetical protein
MRADGPPAGRRRNRARNAGPEPAQQARPEDGVPERMHTADQAQHGRRARGRRGGERP